MILQVYDSDERWMGSARAALLSACETGPIVHLCLSGGSTPKPLYESLARSEEFKSLLDGRDIHLWVGDEREAAPGSGLRNSEMIASCFDGLALTMHSWPTGTRDKAASAYARELGGFGYERFGAGKPFFDLVLLGMGDDGHSAGLFSARDIEAHAESLVRLTEAPSEPKRRMTLSTEVLLSSGKIIVLVRGRSKVRRLMSNLFGEAHDPIGVFMCDKTEVIAQL